MSKSLRSLTCALLVSFVCACASVTFESQDARLDRDFEADSLTIELEYHDVAAIDAKRRKLIGWGVQPGPDLSGAGGFVQAVAHGQRVFILANPVFDWDLEILAEEESLTAEERAYLSRVYVAEARVELGEGGEINLYQRIVFPELTHGLALANAAMRRELGAIVQEEEDLPAPDSASAEMLAIAQADIQAGRDWLTWGPEGLSFEVPIASKTLLGLLQEVASMDLVGMLRDELPLDETDLSQLEVVQSAARILLGAAADIRIGADHTTLVFGDEHADLMLHFGSELLVQIEDFRPALREHLLAEGFEFPGIYQAPQ